MQFTSSSHKSYHNLKVTPQKIVPHERNFSFPQSVIFNTLVLQICHEIFFKNIYENEFAIRHTTRAMCDVQEINMGRENSNVNSKVSTSHNNKWQIHSNHIERRYF